MNQALRLGMVVSLLCLGFGPGAANWSSNNHMVSTSYSPTFEETSDSYTTAFLNVTYTDPETGRLHTEKTEVGKFGEYHVGSAAGQLIQVVSNGEDWDTTGCTLPIRPSDGGEFPKFKWIALVKRGTCNFQVKLDNAFHYNASGVIIYNDRDSTGLDKMKLSTRHRNLSAVFTFKWKGEDLVRLLDNGTKIFASISVASHCTKVISSINSAIMDSLCYGSTPENQCAALTSVLFVSVSFVVLMVMSLAWLVFYYVQRFRYIHAKDRLSRRLCSAAKKALSKIPTKHIKNEDKDSNGEIECCAVCLEAYKYSDVVRILPCRHEFHRSCIDPWLLEHRTCPMCKMDILKYYGFVFTGSQESILHMDMEETVSDSERFHSPIHTINTGPPMRTANIQTLQSGPRPISVESYHTHAHLVLQNQFSRSSTPDELTPALTRVASPGSEAGTGGSHRNMFHRVASESDFSLNRSTPSQMRRSVSLDTIDIATVSPHSPA